jgi:hypothetical protein
MGDRVAALYHRIPMASLEGRPMTNATSGNRAKRARVYFRLMDVTFFLAILGFSEFLLDKVFGIILIQTTSPLYPPVSTFMIFMNFLMPLFLVLARFMRDEYAELLWRRTAVVFAYAIAIIPFIIQIVGWLVYLTRGEEGVRRHLKILLVPTQPYFVIAVAWMAFMLLFVAIFRVLRWRDGR